MNAFLFSLLFLLTSTIEDQTHLIQLSFTPSKKEFSEAELEATMEALTKRFQQSAFRGAKLEQRGKTIVASLESSVYNDYLMHKFKLHFSSNSFHLEKLLTTDDELIRNLEDESTSPEGFTWFDNLELGYFTEAVVGVCSSTEEMNSIVSSLNPKSIKLMWSNSAIDPLETGKGVYPLYALEKSNSRGIDINNVADIDMQLNYETGQPDIFIKLDQEGKQKWAKLTKDMAKNRSMAAIIINDRVYSTPRIMEPIENGYCLVSGTSMRESEEIVLRIALGSLPLNLTIVEECVEKK